jgi:hypothetical protein
MHLKFNFCFNDITLANCCKKLQVFFCVCVYVLTMWYLQASQIPPSSVNCNYWFPGWLISKRVCIFKHFYGGVGFQITLDFTMMYEVIDTYPSNFESLICKLCLPFYYLDHSFLEFICFQLKQLKFVVFIQMSSFICILLNPRLLLCVFCD